MLIINNVNVWKRKDFEISVTETDPIRIIMMTSVGVTRAFFFGGRVKL